MLLFFVRHGDPIYDPDSLTDLGKRQAEALVKRMEVCKPDKIFASSSIRAIKTAEPTANALGKEIEIMDWCHENHAWQELTVTLPNGGLRWLWSHKETEQLFNTPEVRKLDREWYRYPGLERYEKGIKRIQQETDAFLLSLGYRHDYENSRYIAERPNEDRIALFAHEGFGAAFLSCLLDIPYSLYSTHFRMSHSGMTVIEFAGEDVVIPHVLQESNDSHLFAAGISTNYQNYIRF